jgi:hypothetical protein
VQVGLGYFVQTVISGSNALKVGAPRKNREYQARNRIWDVLTPILEMYNKEHVIGLTYGKVHSPTGSAREKIIFAITQPHTHNDSPSSFRVAKARISQVAGPSPTVASSLAVATVRGSSATHLSRSSSCYHQISDKSRGGP